MRYLLSILALTSYLIAVPSSLYALPGGGGVGPDLIWSCQSLAVMVPASVGERRSFCFGYSPMETLSELEFDTTFNGQAADKTTCDGDFQYFFLIPLKFPSANYGTDDTLNAELTYNIAISSFFDILAASGEWSYETYPIGTPPGGSAAAGPFGNVVGGCY